MCFGAEIHTSNLIYCLKTSKQINASLLLENQKYFSYRYFLISFSFCKFFFVLEGTFLLSVSDLLDLSFITVYFIFLLHMMTRSCFVCEQACRGEGLDSGVNLVRTRHIDEIDSGRLAYKIPTTADFLVCWSTVPGKR